MKEFIFPVTQSENHVIPAFLEMVFNQPQNGKRGSESYLRGVRVNSGVLEYKNGENDRA